MKSALGAALLLASLACAPRTQVRPVKKAPPAQPVYLGERSCMVQDFENATDLPDAAKNLGWVEVAQPEGQSDDDTFIALRRRICEMGGDALSQAAWVRDMNDDRPKLKANAWSLP